MAEPNEQEKEVVKSVPAIFVNAFVVGTENNGVRITFGEGTAVKRSRVRGAFLLPKEDALSLSAMIVDLLEKDEREAADGRGVSDGTPK